MARTSLSDQFTARFATELGVRYKKQALKMLHNTAIELMEMYSGMKDYHDVTGNLLNSFAIGIYNDGKLVDIVDSNNVGRDEPTRRTLAKGEKYDLQTYYDGSPVRHVMPNGKSVSSPYVGEYGKGGQDGRMAARRSLAQRHPKARYALIAVVATQYASFVQNKKGHDVLTRVSDMLPGIFEGNILAI